RASLDVVSEELEVRVAVIGAVSLDRRPDDLHVLLRHRLLREAGSCEGLLAFTEHLHSDELVFPKRIELANSDHNLGAAPSHTAANLDERNDVVCRRKELLQLGDRLLERIFEVFHKSSE